MCAIYYVVTKCFLLCSEEEVVEISSPEEVPSPKVVEIPPPPP